MLSKIGPKTDKLITSIFDSVNNETTRNKLKNEFVIPLFASVASKYYNYYMGFVALQLIIILLLMINIYFILTKRN